MNQATYMFSDVFRNEEFDWLSELLVIMQVRLARNTCSYRHNVG